ncbi:hypothetical protein ACIOEW_36590 [Streptomyces sp. NPDC087901]|uniref:hypothetical protein n=1 Tax=Streptomyces sp. NPDC087901 TaxID=3365818 RepID=UPI00382094CA
MRHHRVSRTAELRCCLTGETYQQAYAALRRGQPPIPPASTAEQRNFEADVFDELLKSRNRFTEFTFGIRRIHPHPDTLKIEVESEQRATDLLHRLLPVYELDTGEVYGLLGLRIRQISERGIELHICDRQTSLWLTGLPPSAWRRITKNRPAELAPGWRSLWHNTGTWTAEEAASETQWNTPKWTQHFYDGAWCTSGLLRRLAAFHTVAPAYAVTGWKGLGIPGYGDKSPVRWCLEVDYRPGVPQHRDQLVGALTDPVFGLPLASAQHLDASRGGPLPAHIVQLDDAGRTALIELRSSIGMFDSLKKRHPDVDARIRNRVQRILTRHENWSRAV